MKKNYDMSNAKRGAILPSKGKTRITIYIDNETIKIFQQEAEKKGKGYQTLINDALKESLKEKRIDSPIVLRRIIREELEPIKKQVYG